MNEIDVETQMTKSIRGDNPPESILNKNIINALNKK